MSASGVEHHNESVEQCAAGGSERDRSDGPSASSAAHGAVLVGIVQIVLYLLLVVNFRAVAQANLIWSVGSDVTIASMNFFVLKRIVQSVESGLMFAAYVTGSAVGSVSGILLSKMLLGS